MPNDLGRAPTTATTAISPETADIWLRQQQQPDTLLADFAIWRLEDTAPSGQLAAAWARLWQDDPRLRLRLDLDETGNLLATISTGLAPLDLLWDGDEVAARAALHARLAAPDAPLVALALCIRPKGSLLAILRHHLLTQDLPMDRLRAGLMALIDGHALPQQPVALPPAPPLPEVGDPTALILDAFRQALGNPHLRAEDDFFDHGGHSLLATRVIGRLMDLHGIEIAFEDIFSHASAARLAGRARLTRAAPPPPRVTTAQVGDDFAQAPLSLAQQSLWKASAAHGHGAVFNLPFILRFLAPVDERVFATAFRDLMIRHPVMRSLFIETAGMVTQHIVPTAAIDSYRWFWTSDEAGQASLMTEAEHPFDLERELPVRLRFLRDGQGQVLSFLLHHIVLDEWSLNQLMAELGQAYAARATGRAPDWPDDPPGFHLFAREQQAAGGMQAHLDWWIAHLRDLPPPPVITADPETDAATDIGPAPRGLVRLDLDPSLTTGLRRAARQLDASLFNLFHAGVAAALQSIAGLDQLAVGTSASGRQDARWFDTVGYFTTVVCHRLRFSPDMTLATLVAQSRDLVARSLPHSEIPIDLVEEALPGGAPPNGAHVFEVFIQIHAGNALNGALPDPAGPIPYRQIEIAPPPSILALHVEVMEDATTPDRDLHLTLNHRADRYDAAQAAAIVARIHDVLAQLATPDGAAIRLADLAHPAADAIAENQEKDRS